MIIWCTLATQNYVPKVRAYLESVAAHAAGIDALYFGCVGFQPAPDVPAPWQSFIVPDLWMDERLGNPGNGCIQHGNFLPYLPVGNDDTIVVTDGDITMQRPLTADERGLLLDWPEDVIGIGPNAGPADTLADEARRIYPRVTIEALAARFWPGREAPLCGNAGVIVARRRTWLDLWARYLGLFGETRKLFAQIAVQQWTINLAAEQIGRAVLPFSFHAHQHYGIPPGCEDRAGVAYANGQLALLAHHWWPDARIADHLGGHEGKTWLDIPTLEYLKERFTVCTMLDVGCGPGGMLDVAIDQDIAALGIDGAPGVERPDILIHDYTTGAFEMSPRDLVWCVEFVEHVEACFIENYLATFRAGRVLYLTHALPGQGGHHHVNEQPSSYWANLLTEDGWKLDREATAHVRQHSATPFGRATGMVFVRGAAK